MTDNDQFPRQHRLLARNLRDPCSMSSWLCKDWARTLRLRWQRPPTRDVQQFRWRTIEIQQLGLNPRRCRAHWRPGPLSQSPRIRTPAVTTSLAWLRHQRGVRHKEACSIQDFHCHQDGMVSVRPRCRGIPHGFDVIREPKHLDRPTTDDLTALRISAGCDGGE